MRPASPTGWISIALAVTLVLDAPLAASELQERTAKAYAEYFAEARRAFVERAGRGTPARPPAGSFKAVPGKDDGINDLPGGLVHHWVGSTFIPGVTLAAALDAMHDYASYASVYEPILASTLIGHDADTYRVHMRLKGGGGGVSAVLDVRSTIEYVQPRPDRVYSISNADEIREVKHAGSRRERLLPPGDDSGYLWRANTMTLITRVDGGLIVEMETLGLSRDFPMLLGWFIEPIARRIGRGSVEQSLREFAGAMRAETLGSKW